MIADNLNEKYGQFEDTGTLIDNAVKTLNDKMEEMEHMLMDIKMSTAAAAACARAEVSRRGSWERVGLVGGVKREQPYRAAATLVCVRMYILTNRRRYPIRRLARRRRGNPSPTRSARAARPPSPRRPRPACRSGRRRRRNCCAGVGAGASTAADAFSARRRRATGARPPPASSPAGRRRRTARAAAASRPPRRRPPQRRAVLALADAG